jgi:GNAT superfamily N-acetyltransferase
MDTVLKLATTGDQAFLSELFSNVRSVEFAPLGLPEQALTQLLAMQFRAQQSGYAAQFPQAVDRILWSGTTRIGRLLVNESQDEVRLVDIALLAPYRGQGRGGHLIQGLCVQAIKAGLPLRLSVRFGNPAEHLYERLGFVRTGGDGVYVTMEFRKPGASGESIQSEPHLQEESVENIEQGFTRAYFRTWTGHAVKATSLDGVEVELSVEDVKALKAPIGGPLIDVGDSFVISFRGPVRPALPTACADLKPEIGETMSIFLVPIACDADGMKYEAIFNRMKARI